MSLLERNQRNLILLSAGKGERLRPWTEQTPKPAIPFLSVPMSAWVLSLVDRISLRHLVVNTHHLSQQIEDLHWRLKWPCQKLIFSHEKELLGSSGGIHAAQRHLTGQNFFLAANADSIFLPSQDGCIELLIEEHQRNKNLATYLVVTPPKGDQWTTLLADSDMHLKGFSSQKSVSGTPFHYIGWAVYSDRISHFFNDRVSVEQLFEHTIPRALQAGEKVGLHLTKGRWFETGNSNDFLSASETCLQILESREDSFEKRFLEQTIRLQGGSEALIERENKQFLQQLTSVLSKIR